MQPIKTISSENPRVLILGSQPREILPDVEPDIVFGANGAVKLALTYREKCNSIIVSIVGSGVLKTDKYVQKLILESKPDYIVVIGEKIENTQQFLDDLGVSSKILEVLSFKERHYLINEFIGRKALIYGIKNLKSVLKQIIKNPLKFHEVLVRNSFASTGVNALLYTIKRFPNYSSILIDGVSLVGGRHFYGKGMMDKRRAKVDYRIIKKSDLYKRTNIKTTNQNFANVSDIPMFNDFYFSIDDKQ